MANHKDEIIVIRKSELNFSRDRTVISWGYHTVRTGNPYTSLQRMIELLSMSGYRVVDSY